jgi:hypothetical protein
MTSIAPAPSALEVRLTELEGFGLGRPANLLFSEYVTVLLAQGVFDAATAERMSFTFYAAHYGGLNPEDPSFTETIARLEEVTARLAAMPADARLALSERVQGDIRTLSGNAARLATEKVTVAVEQGWNARPMAADRLSDPRRSSSNGFSDDGLVQSVPVDAAATVWKRRRRNLNFMIPAAFGLIFAGYASRNLIDLILERDGNTIRSSHRATRESPKEVPQNPIPKEQILDNWAVTEAGLKHDQKAKFAYELLLTYRPENAKVLNNLAWLYLTTNDPEVHNSQRGLELAMRAISQQRSAVFLDTAAEAYFQTGNPEEAVKLEEEALDELVQSGSFQRVQLELILNQQLEKFAAARKPQPASAPARSAGAASSKPPAARTPGI